MKSFLIITTLSLFMSLVININSDGIIEGKVIAESTNELIIIATVMLHRDGEIIKGTETDFDGYYKFDHLQSGTYEVSVSYVGYADTKVVDINITNDKATKVDITMSQGIELDEVEILEYKLPIIKYDHTTSRSTITADKISALPTKTISEIATTSAGVSISKKASSDISIGSGRSSMTNYYIDGVRVSTKDGFIPREKLKKEKSITMESEETTLSTIVESEITAYDDLPEAGQLTAAEWNDLDNWSDWNQLVIDGVYQSMNKYWDLEYQDRYSAFVTNEKNLPVVNCTVQLLDGNKNIVWETKTDNKGKAELWTNAENSEDLSLIATYNNEHFDFKSAKTSADGSNYLNLPISCFTPTSLDIMFVVDATSSMGDEINYLRSELNDVIERVKPSNEEIEFRLGTVFYKDKTDDYLTKVSPLSKDFEKTIDFIKSNSANGGGDYPEAVEAGLDVALNQDWNENAMNRIVFLLLDAPPHHNKEVLKKVEKQINTAATMGIKLIPITASGIDRETEFLMKQMSILTNGTYVFITDDSGIGNPHLTPVVPDYKVEKLNDLLVRLISNYSEIYDCDKEAKTIAQAEINIYPNPAMTMATVEIDQDLDQLILYSATGKTLQTIQNLKKGKIELDVSNYPAGMYAIKILKKEVLVGSKTLMVVN